MRHHPAQIHGSKMIAPDEESARLLKSTSNISVKDCKQGSYTSSRLPRELVAALMVYFCGVNLPIWCIRPYFGVHMRPIPYQILPNSKDVVLDLTLNNPLVEDVQVPSWLLHFSGFYFPLLVIVLVTFLLPNTKLNNKYHDVHSAVCVLLTAVGTSEFITQVIKFYVGRLRPNFYALCGFDTTSLKCTNPIEMEMEGRCSFPSGHSSFSTCGMGVLALFFLGRVGIMTAPGLANKKTKLKAFLSLMPLVYSTYCASSRLYDNWHHPSDVVAGICLGLFCSTFVYHLFYAPIFSPMAGTPLSYISALNDGQGVVSQSNSD